MIVAFKLGLEKTVESDVESAASGSIEAVLDLAKAIRE